MVLSEEQFQRILTSIQNVPIAAATAAAAKVDTPKFRLKDIGYFNPDNESTEPVTHTSDGTRIFYNIFLFT